MATLLSRAALATFRVPVRTTVMPRNTVYRFRVLADRDPSTVIHRLTECDVEILGIRRCAEPIRRDRATAQAPQESSPAETVETVETAETDATVGGVVIPFPARSAPCPTPVDSAPGGCSSTQPGLDPEGNDPAG